MTTRPWADPASRHAVDAAATLSDADFAAISGRIHRDTGIVIGEAKRSMLISRLARRLRQLALPDFATYARLLDSAEGEDERLALVSAITTNVTGFFREPHHFDALTRMLPDLVARVRAGGRVRLWSAGCSTGQEAYSIAATLLHGAPGLGQGDLRILATDIDPQVIDQARRGVFDRRLLGDSAPAPLRRFVQDGPGSGQFALAPELQALIRFEVLNLLGPWPFTGGFDVIFCRNVVIYFDTETRRRLWARFAGRLAPGGTLFLGHSERMDPELEPLFAPAGITQYRRTAQPAPSDALLIDPPSARMTAPCP
jgi:chemotaxis protein methyltransferase CheR